MIANHNAEGIRKEAVTVYSKVDLMFHNFPQSTEESGEVAGLRIESRASNLPTRRGVTNTVLDQKRYL
jgi:hypothetical protein